MKNKLKTFKINYFVISLTVTFLITFISCAGSSLSLRVLVPAEININKEIKHIGIINRSLPADNKRVMNLVEGFISGETIMGDRIGSNTCLNGLAETLNNSPRFTAVIIAGERLRGTGTRRLPPQLSWRRVEQICDKYRVDGLIALEIFDSDISLKRHKKMITKRIKDKKTKKKIKVKVPQYRMRLYIDVNSAWKVYDPSNRSIVDVSTYTDRKSWRSRGKTRGEARRELPTKREAINEAGYFAGLQYGARVSPTWIQVNRFYYVKGSPEFKEAHRYVKTGDLKQAERIWKRILEGNDIKMAGRAAYNLAFAAEIRGDFEPAYQWAKMSYSKYGNKKAYHFMEVIRNRMAEKQQLEEQLEDK